MLLKKSIEFLDDIEDLSENSVLSKYVSNLLSNRAHKPQFWLTWIVSG